MSNVKAMVGKLLTGQLKLDVPTAAKIIEEASRDERIDAAAELAPLKELFSGDNFKASVDGTTSGKTMLKGFLVNAARVHDRAGDGKSAEVRGLKSLSVEYTAGLVSKDAVRELLGLYRGTTADDPHYDSVDSTSSIREVTPAVAEAWRKAAEKDLTKYLEGGPVSRFLMRVGVGKDFIDKVYENDPQDYIRRYLETYSTLRTAGGGQPLDAQVRALEVDKIKEALRASGGDHTAAARRLGISPATLDRKISDYGIR
jgi:hypothetical protein